LRKGLLTVTGAANLDEEVSFYRSFAALHLAGLEEGEALRAEIVNRLQELVADNVDGQDILLFHRLCRIAREGAANAAKWTRSSLLAQLQGSVRLKVAPSFSDDIDRLNAASLDALNDVSETVDDFHVARDGLQAASRTSAPEASRCFHRWPAGMRQVGGVEALCCQRGEVRTDPLS
jgi:hypothetical protein